MKTLSRFLALVGCLLLGATTAWAQDARYQTRTGTTSFFSASPLENIEARSQQTSALLDLQTSQLAFSLPIRSFQFKRSLMQEHFNENYLESERYPKATFVGHLLDAKPAELRETAAAQTVTADGDLTIHGVTRHVRVPGTLQLQNGQLLVQATFTVAPAEYKIEIPALVRDHIAKSVQVSVRLAAAPVRDTAAKP
ncbi:Polyisoprenoid-binding protein YceI [Hymenobacter gelipurpurascens]|uniref:Polyisoprenoid-binding protein YceI n=1 Tax=Hymenobacter gelipurpurascens TaxID=89968 RepID=A0A212UAN9_9BACT|nr:YceI family protein [Hymenobacter gelipurpurascens]SNC75348.1 Polyisoprenoid-binding protein YceI [Hymenobacter gelipurpurascens]